MKSFLVVIDMQKDFVDGSLGSAEAVSIVPSVAEKIKNFGGNIIVTYDTHDEGYLESPEGLKLPVSHCIKGTDGWELDSAVRDALKEKEYIKIEKGTFAAKNLPEVIEKLAQGEPFRTEFVGLCTDICVVSNVLLLKAFFPDSEISVDSSCCAGVTLEKHNAALETMRSCQIDII